jgi:hypothetical protein
MIAPERRATVRRDIVRPFDQIVVKIHSRCNLACDHCYVYEHADQGWRYEELLAFAPPAMDLLLPHGNWTNPPPRPENAPSYADWLIAVFDRWYDAPRLQTSIRLSRPL